MKHYVLHHAHCTDGFTAAYVASKFLPKDAVFVPVQYGHPMPPIEDHSWVYILDFSFNREALTALAARSSIVVLLDHHQSAQEDLKDLQAENLIIRFDMKKSGARLAWEYFHQEEPPFLIELVQDRDLWSWKIPQSRELSAYIESLPRTFENWDMLMESLQRPWLQKGYMVGDTQVPEEWVYSGQSERAVEQGAAILRYKEQIVGAACQNAHEIEMDGYKVLCVNATACHSEIGERLARGRPFAATFRLNKEGNLVWSLRSDENGLDVSRIARRWPDGGGHRHAAGGTESRLPSVSVQVLE